MSVTSKLTLGAAVAFTASVLTYVHTAQKRDRAVRVWSLVRARLLVGHSVMAAYMKALGGDVEGT